MMMGSRRVRKDELAKGTSGHANVTQQIHLVMNKGTSSDLLLPGQPIPRWSGVGGPAPQLGTGTYTRDGQARASLVGRLSYEGAVGLHAPAL
jgi:hypothetical protein